MEPKITFKDVQLPKLAAVWMYFTTDGDSGRYGVKLFSSESAARSHKEQRGNAYAEIEKVEIE